MFILITLGKFKLTLFGPIYHFGQVTVILPSLGKTYLQKQFQPSRFNKNSITTHGIWHF